MPKDYQLDWRNLELFVTLADHLNFTKAAAQAGIAQPALSRRIRALELELGVKLLRRSTRRVALTAAGQHLKDGAMDLLSKRQGLANAVRHLAAGEAGTLRLGVVTAYPLLVGALRQLRANHPRVMVQIIASDNETALRAIREGDMDIAVVRGPVRAPDLSAVTLVREPLIAAVPKDHPLAEQPCLKVASLAGEPFVLFPRRSAPGMYDAVTGLCEAAGFSPDIVQEAATWGHVVGMVSAGLGITITPASAETALPADVVFRRLEPTRNVELSCLSPLSENALVSRMREALLVAGATFQEKLAAI